MSRFEPAMHPAPVTTSRPSPHLLQGETGPEGSSPSSRGPSGQSGNSSHLAKLSGSGSQLNLYLALGQGFYFSEPDFPDL